MKATIIYHLASGRIVREPVDVPEDASPDRCRDILLANIGTAMLQPATRVAPAAVVPMITVVDDRGRSHLIVTANLEDLELALEP